MRHLDDGTLRRLLDEPLALADSQKRHLINCSSCTARYAAIEEDARVAAAALELPAYSPRTAAALTRVTQRVAVERRPRSARSLEALRRQIPPMGRLVGGVAAACAVLVGIMVTPAGSLAQSFVTIFQPTQVTAVRLSSLDIRSLAQLRHYGTMRVPVRVPVQTATSAASASTLVGMKVLVPSSLPSGVPAAVSYDVSSGGSTSFTFNAQTAAAWAARSGRTLPAMPAAIDGSTIQLTVGSSVVTTYGCSLRCSTIPQLIIGQMVAPRITSTGADLKQLESYVSNLPGVSSQLAAELRSIGDPTSTLPIPIPSGFAHVDDVTVQGVHGEAIGDNTGVGSLVVWEKDGIVYAVGGGLPLDQVEAVANGLH